MTVLLCGSEIKVKTITTEFWLLNSVGNIWMPGWEELMATLNCQRQADIIVLIEDQTVIRTVWLRDLRHWPVDHGVSRRELNLQSTKFLLDLNKQKTSRSSE